MQSHIRSSIVAVIATAAFTRDACAQAPFNTGPVQELESIVAELERGISVRDPEPWRKYMADDGTLVNRDGKTNTKQEIVDELTPLPPGRSLQITPVDVKVRLAGSAALVSFIADEKLTIFGQNVDTKYPSTMYFEQRNGQWQMVYFSYFELPVDPPRVEVSKEYLRTFTGAYRVSESMEIEVSANDSTLIYRKPGAGGPGTVLYPIDRDGRFFRAGTESEFIFEPAGDGGMILRQRRNWIDLIWRRKGA